MNVNYRYRAPEIVHVRRRLRAEALVFHGAFAEVVDRSAPIAARAASCWCRSTTATVCRCWREPSATRSCSTGSSRCRPIARAATTGCCCTRAAPPACRKAWCGRHAGLFGALAFTGYASMGVPVPDTADEVGRVAAELSASGRSPVNMTAPPLMHGTALFLAFSTFVLGGTVVLLAGRRFDAGGAAASGAARAGHPAVDRRRRVRAADRGRAGAGRGGWRAVRPVQPGPHRVDVAPRCRPTCKRGLMARGAGGRRSST